MMKRSRTGAVERRIPAQRLVARHDLQELRQVRAREHPLDLGRQLQRHRRVPLRHDAGVHHQPAVFLAAPCADSAASRAARRGRARRAPRSSVSSRCTLRPPWATASRCRSWLPSRQVAALLDLAESAQRGERLRTTIDEVAQHEQVVARRRKGDLCEQAFEWLQASLHVADEIVHGLPFCYPCGSLIAARTGRTARRARHGRCASRLSDPAERRVRNVGDGAHRQPQGTTAGDARSG